jgi:polar amino acid transport system permease protein
MFNAAFFTQLWATKVAIIHGLGITALVSILSIVLGTILGLLVGLVLSYAPTPIRFLARIYTDFVRGTPVLVMLLTTYYLPSVFKVNIPPIQAGITALSVFLSSHVAEMLRGSLLNLPKGQTEAANSIGLSFLQTFLFILLPQALRQILPTWVNAAVETLKASTLVSVIGVADLLLSTQQIIALNFMTLPFFMFAGMLYFSLAYGIQLLGKSLENRVAIK